MPVHNTKQKQHKKDTICQISYLFLRVSKVHNIDLLLRSVSKVPSSSLTNGTDGFSSCHTAFVFKGQGQAFGCERYFICKDNSASALKEFYLGKQLECLLLISFPKQSKSLKKHIQISFLFKSGKRSCTEWGGNRPINSKSTTKFSRSVSDGRERLWSLTDVRAVLLTETLLTVS